MKSILTIVLSLIIAAASAQTVSTVAGMAGVVGSTDGPAASASFNNPHGVACDPQGNIYVANRYGHNIRKITPGGVVSTFAGSGSPGANDGTGTAASFNEPWAVACDTLGNIYVADTKNYKIRKITSSGVVTTVAGTGAFGVTNGPVATAQFGFPVGIAVNKAGSAIYVADRMTHTIRKIAGGQVTTHAGVVYSPGSTDGPGASAKFDHPYSIAIDAAGSVIVADEFNNKIRKVTNAGIVSTLAGDGSAGSADGAAASASFNAPWGVCVAPNGDVYVGDGNNFTVRKIAAGAVSTYAGQNGVPGSVNGSATTASFNGVSSLWIHPVNGTIFLCDPFSQLVRKITAQAAQNITLTATGGTTFCEGTNITLNASPSGLSNYVFMDGSNIIGTSANGILTINTLAQGLHSITCSATNGSGQTVSSNTLSLSITAGLNVTINISGSTTLCPGQSVTLSSSVAGTYLWSNGATTASINVSNAATYTLTVSNGSGCSGVAAPVQVTNLQAPLATITSSSALPVCSGDSLMLTAGNGANFQWSNGASSQITYATAPGNYTVMVTNGAGCSAISLPVTVAFFPSTNSSISPTGNIVIVQGANAVLTANSGNSYLWSTGSTSQAITVTTAGNYTVTVTDANGCKSAPATSQVSLLSSANLVTANGPTSFCNGDSVKLSSAFINGNQWFKNGVSIAGATSQHYMAKASGYYHVLYTPTSGIPVNSDSIQVIIRTVPNQIAATGDTVCQGEVAMISAPAVSGLTYQWYTAATGGTIAGTGLNFTTSAVQQTTTYYVTAVNSFGCESDQRTAVTVITYQVPEANFTATNPAPVNGGFEVQFTNAASSASSYYWDFGDPSSNDNNSSDPDPMHLYVQPGDYTVTLITSSAEGCTDTISKILTVVLNNHLFVPTGFTPNNDGNNDIFRVRGNNISHSEMHIYNQWGQQIWFSLKETTGWDGKMNGETVPNGTYAYMIRVTFDNGTTELLRGNISVIR